MKIQRLHLVANLLLMAVASVTFVGYAGILLGPAIIGFGAQYTSLPLAMASLALLGSVYLISPVHKGTS